MELKEVYAALEAAENGAGMVETISTPRRISTVWGRVCSRRTKSRVCPHTRTVCVF